MLEAPGRMPVAVASLATNRGSLNGHAGLLPGTPMAAPMATPTGSSGGLAMSAPERGDGSSMSLVAPGMEALTPPVATLEERIPTAVATNGAEARPLELFTTRLKPHSRTHVLSSSPPPGRPLTASGGSNTATLLSTRSDLGSASVPLPGQGSPPSPGSTSAASLMPSVAGTNTGGEQNSTVETIDALRGEIGDLRSELETLRSLLGDGLQQREEAERSRGAAVARLEKLQRRKAEAESQLRDAHQEASRLRSQLARCQRDARDAVSVASRIRNEQLGAPDGDPSASAGQEADKPPRVMSDARDQMRRGAGGGDPHQRGSSSPTASVGGDSRSSRARAQRHHSDREQRPSLNSMEAGLQDGERSARSQRPSRSPRSTSPPYQVPPVGVPPPATNSARGASAASREASRSNLRPSASDSVLGSEDYLSSRHTTPRMAPPRQKPTHAAGNELPGMPPWSPGGVALVSGRSERSPPSRYRQMPERATMGGDDRTGLRDVVDDGLRRSPSRASGIMARADDMDDMWCAVLQRFPQYPDWVLVKEKAGVYRMGGAGGKKILCRISHGGLQVRVGGGWMNAINFLERHGPTGMGIRSGDETPTRECIGRRGAEDAAMIGTSPSMERLLVPTKCWAQKIGINTTPDIREQRQLASAEEERQDARRQAYAEEDPRMSGQPELGNDFWRVRKLVRDGADPQDSPSSMSKRTGAETSPGPQAPSRVSGSASTAISSVMDPPVMMNAGTPQAASSAPTPRPGLAPAAGPLASVVLSSAGMQPAMGMQGVQSPARNGMATGSLRAPVMQQPMPTTMQPAPMGPGLLDASQFVQTGNSWRFANDPAMRSPVRSLSPYGMDGGSGRYTVNGPTASRAVSPYAPM